MFNLNTAQDVEGKCQVDSAPCTTGIYVSLKCPNQPDNVRCCVNMGFTNNWVPRKDWGAEKPKGKPLFDGKTKANKVIKVHYS